MSANVKVRYSKRFWPRCGTIVDRKPYDLQDLWEEHEGQASTFIANALIDEPPIVCVDLNDKKYPVITVFLWSVGGDTITLRVRLADAIRESTGTYDFIRGPEQCADVEKDLAGLDELERALKSARKHLEGQIADWRRRAQLPAAESSKEVL